MAKCEDFLLEGNAEQQEAAVRIQAVQRGKAARKDVESLKAGLQDVSELKLLHKAMLETKIQEDVAFKGTLSEQAAARRLKAMERGTAARLEVVEMERNVKTAEAELDQAHSEQDFLDTTQGTGYDEDHDLTELEEEEKLARKRSKSIIRGAAAQKELDCTRLKLAQAEKAVEENLGFEGTADEQAAAVEMKALYRGNVARQQVAEIQRRVSIAEELIDSLDETVKDLEYVSFEGMAEEQAAALRIQAMQRGLQARKEVKELRDKLMVAEAVQDEVMFEGTPLEQAVAVKIQAIQREKMARKHQLEKRAKAAKGTAEQTVILEELDELFAEPEEETAADTEYPDDEQNVTGYDVPKELLRRGLAPEHVADLFYEALYDNELVLWLATLAEVTKTHPRPPTPGGFASVGWKDGRNKLRKYGCYYKYLGEKKGGLDEATKTLLYQPLYGAVPGYKKDTPMKEPVRITLIDELDEWRVLKADF